jgi:hypothetical protein
MSSSIPPIPTRSLTPPPSAAEAEAAVVAARLPSPPPGGAAPSIGAASRTSSDISLSGSEGDTTGAARPRAPIPTASGAAGVSAPAAPPSEDAGSATSATGSSATLLGKALFRSGWHGVKSAGSAVLTVATTTADGANAVTQAVKNTPAGIVQSRKRLQKADAKNSNSFEKIKSELQSESQPEGRLTAELVGKIICTIEASIATTSNGLQSIKEAVKKNELGVRDLETAKTQLAATKQSLRNTAAQIKAVKQILNQIRSIAPEDSSGRESVVQRNASLVDSGRLDVAVTSHIEQQITEAQGQAKRSLDLLKENLGGINKEDADTAFESAKGWHVHAVKLITAAKEMQGIVEHTNTNVPQAREDLVAEMTASTSVPAVEVQGMKADLEAKAQAAQTAMAAYKLRSGSQPLLETASQAAIVQAAQTALDDAIILTKAQFVRAQTGVVQASNKAVLAEVSPQLAAFVSKSDIPFAAKDAAETLRNSLANAMVNADEWAAVAERDAKYPAQAGSVAQNTQVRVANLQASLAWAVDFAAFANKPQE